MVDKCRVRTFIIVPLIPCPNPPYIIDAQQWQGYPSSIAYAGIFTFYIISFAQICASTEFVAFACFGTFPVVFALGRECLKGGDITQ